MSIARKSKRTPKVYIIPLYNGFNVNSYALFFFSFVSHGNLELNIYSSLKWSEKMKKNMQKKKATKAAKKQQRLKVFIILVFLL